MQEYKRLVGVLWVAVGLTGIASTGCRKDPRSDLAKAADKARRLCDQACGHLNDPVYKIGGEFAPLTAEKPGKADGNSITLVPAGTLNERAWKALELADSELTAALGSSGDASAADKALAHAVLARVLAAKGYHQAILAAQKRDQAWLLLRKMEDAAIEMADHGKRVGSCDQLLAVTDPTLGQMATKADADATAAAGKITGLKTKIADLAKQKASLIAANEKLLAEARKLRVASRLAPVLKGIELFDQARAKEDEATANSTKITEIEDANQVLVADIQTIELDVSAAAKRKTDAAKIAGDRSRDKADIQTRRDGFVRLLTDAQKQVETLAGQVIEVCGKAGADEQAAVEAYGKGAAQYDSYDKVTAKGKGGAKADPAIWALYGDLRLARADLRVRQLALQERITHMVGEVTKLWSGLPVQKDVPGVVGQVTGYLAAADQAKKDATEDFRWAVKDYEKARPAVRRELQWAYRLQVAAACAGMYRLTADQDAQKQGTEALDALTDEAGSPYVSTHAAHLRKLLGGAEAPPAAP